MTWQTALTIFYVFWLVAVLALLFIIYRSSQDRLQHVERLEGLLIDQSQESLQAARTSADAAHMLAEELTKRKNHDTKEGT